MQRSWLSNVFVTVDALPVLVLTLLHALMPLPCSSFIVCCGKLVFLPAVIAWQVFDEVRDKLQAKYHELQTNSQVC